MGYLVHYDDAGEEVEFSKDEVTDFINDVNDMIDDISKQDFMYAKETMSSRDFEAAYRQYEKE